jgi:pimeloyl-ACP methyl ester carboxylesterase
MTAVSAEIRERSVDVWNGTVKLRFKIAGSAGAPLIYFHPAAGLFFDPFLSALAVDHTVYAPEHPGTSTGDPDAIHKVDSIWDLVLLYEEAIRRLDLPAAPVAIGQSFGGMMAAELAAHFPSLFKSLILLNPLGLWREDLPITNWMTTPPTALPALLFRDAQHPAAKAMFTPPKDPEEALSRTAHMIWTFGCTGKFVWPIPERGLHKRLHRISTPTLIVWGADDGLVPAGYAKEFGQAITTSRIEIIPNCGHIPQAEQGDTTMRLVRDFLGSSDADLDRPREVSR